MPSARSQLDELPAQLLSKSGMPLTSRPELRLGRRCSVAVTSLIVDPADRAYALRAKTSAGSQGISPAIDLHFLDAMVTARSEARQILERR